MTYREREKTIHNFVDKYLKEAIKEMSADQKTIKKRRANGKHFSLDDHNFAMLSIKLSYLFHLRESYKLYRQGRLKPDVRFAHTPYIPHSYVNIDSCNNLEIRRFVKRTKKNIKEIVENVFRQG